MEIEVNQEVFGEEFYNEFFNDGIYLLKEDMPGMAQESALAEQVPVKESLKIKGDRNAHTLILIYYQAPKQVNPAHIEFLSKILKAVNLDIDKVAILNVASERDIDQNEIYALPATRIIAFDTPMGFLSVDIPLYTLTSDRGKQVFITDGLADIEASKELKTGLWNALKKMYL